MVAVAWTAIGLLGATLATLVAVLFRLGDRIDAQGRELRAAIDGQGARIEAQGARIEAQGARIDAQGADLRAAIDAQTARIDGLSSRLDTHLERHAG